MHLRMDQTDHLIPSIAKNESCPDGKALRDSIALEIKLIEGTKEMNQKNGYDIEKLKMRKFIAGITFYRLSDVTGIPVTTISEYFNYRKPIPSEDYNKINNVLQEALK